MEASREISRPEIDASRSTPSSVMSSNSAESMSIASVSWISSPCGRSLSMERSAALVSTAAAATDDSSVAAISSSSEPEPEASSARTRKGCDASLLLTQMKTFALPLAACCAKHERSFSSAAARAAASRRAEPGLSVIPSSPPSTSSSAPASSSSSTHGSISPRSSDAASITAHVSPCSSVVVLESRMWCPVHSEPIRFSGSSSPGLSSDERIACLPMSRGYVLT